MENFDKQIKDETIILSGGEEIERLDGHINVAPKDYRYQLPIDVLHIRSTYQLINHIKIEKGEAK